jgi:hypothetical protein
MSTVKRARYATGDSTGVVTAARMGNGRCATREVRCRGEETTPTQLRIREDQRGRRRMADGFVVPRKPGNAGGGKEP